MHMPIDPATIAIRAHNVTLSLGTRDAPVEILKGVDLVMLRGESIAILGASGSGKSSLMAVLCGLERASGGDVHIGGVDFGALDEDALARARRGRIGIVLQSFHLLPTMTALENVAVPLELAGDVDAFAPASTIIPPNCRVVNSSASPSPAPSRHGRPSCSPTNRPAILTRRQASPSWTCCSIGSARLVQPLLSSRTILHWLNDAAGSSKCAMARSSRIAPHERAGLGDKLAHRPA